MQKQLRSNMANKLTNSRSRLRAAIPSNLGERCAKCSFYSKPVSCKVVEGPVKPALVCDWIQSRGVLDVPKYKVADGDWLSFVEGMKKTQPYQHKVVDGAFTPAGPLVLIEDTAKPKEHYFSLGKKFHVEHTSLEHHWPQVEVDTLINIGKGSGSLAQAGEEQHGSS